ncbi:MAG TPA: 3'-5' exonuclease, partial [Vicinamibacterales bacterium]|nr:3'-5' exonuclease [Vicinamibacterales bacterium]
RVTLSSSFRARPNIQRAINVAFAPAMTGDAITQQAHYVPLEPTRPDDPRQPSVVVLPVPEPYATQRIAATAIDKALPDAVGAFVEWLVRKSGWHVEVGGRRVKIGAGHICILFRRFISYDVDVTRPYVDALEARSLPHLLVGGRSFHDRAEVEALRAALCAIERPDDELSVFATLRGPFFGIDDEALATYRHRYGRFHPFHVPIDLGAGGPGDDVTLALRPIGEALTLLRSLHGPRNRVPVASTITALLDATRAHVRFALEHGGEQVLANVLRVADLGRQFEADGGVSFRGFLEELEAQAETGRAEEAPILEDASDGVRLMTVHKAKGLEFPVVILADMTAKLRPAVASRYLDPDRRLCAVRLAGCSPDDLIRQGPIELERDAAEGVRVAYVAATRAQDLLVVPAVGDDARDGWLETLNPAIFPPLPQRRTPADSTMLDAASRYPAFTSRDSVLRRPHGDPATAETVSPGVHRLNGHEVVWWDPRTLQLGAVMHGGLRHGDLIRKDVPAEVIEEGLSNYREWHASRLRAIDLGSTPTLAVQQVTQRVRVRSPQSLPHIGVARISAPATRPGGRRFGTLVHSVLALTPLDADRTAVDALARIEGRLTGASDEEIAAAVECVLSALEHELFSRARAAQAEGRCRREVPVIYRADDGTLLEGAIDLAFEESGSWTVVDFKTNDSSPTDAHRRQLAHYIEAVRQASDKPVSGTLFYL